jgi:hypothetical protein
MAKVIPLDRFLKLLVYCVIAMVCLGFGGVFSEHVRHTPDASRWLRWLAVVIGTLSILPWMAIVVGGLWLGDEYVRHVALVGTAIAFGANVVFDMALAHMRNVRLVDAGAHLAVLPVAMALWVLGVGAAALYYRVRV